MPLYDRVYNLLDGGDNRKAEKECDSILKKIQKKKSSSADPSEWQTVMALKGIAIYARETLNMLYNWQMRLN